MISPSPGSDLVRRLGMLSSTVNKERQGVQGKMAMAAKRAHADVIRIDSGGDMRLSGVGKRGAKVGARFDTRGSTTEIKATGPLHFVAHPMSPHRIPKARRRGRKRYAVIPGVGVRAWAQHPGTRGKNTWQRGRVKAKPAVTKVARVETAKAIRKGFTG